MMSKMAKTIIVIALFATSMLAVTGCGGGTNVDGQGNTVFLTASTKNATSPMVFTSTLTLQNDAVFSYSVKSTAYTGMTPSSATITGASISFTQIAGPTNVPIASWHAPLTGYLSGGGEWSIDNLPVIATPPVYSPVMGAYQYKASLQFTATEATGQSISCNTVDTTIFVTPVLSTIAFAKADTPADTIAVTLTSGTAPYTVTWSSADLLVSSVGNTVTVGLVATAATAATVKTATITVTDSTGKQGYIYVTYFS